MTNIRVAWLLAVAVAAFSFGAARAGRPELRVDQDLRLSIEFFPPGTGLAEWFTAGELDTATGPSYGRWQPGDRLERKCMSVAEATGEPCDSVSLQVELGRGQLPLGIEFAMLGLAFEPGFLKLDTVDWDFPLENFGAALDRRFVGCGPGNRSTYLTRVQVMAADTTARSIRIGLVAAERAAVLAYRMERWEEAASASQDVLAIRPGDPTWEVLYAGALRGAGWQRQYAHQVERLNEIGLGSKSRDAVPAPRR